MSPLLILLTAKGLNRLFSQASDLDLFRGVSVGTPPIQISLLQFADEALIFCLVELDYVRSLKQILRCFELIYGLHISFKKSGLSTINVNRD